MSKYVAVQSFAARDGGSALIRPAIRCTKPGNRIILIRVIGVIRG